MDFERGPVVPGAVGRASGLWVGFFLVGGACSRGTVGPAEGGQAVVRTASVSAASLRDDVSFLASDALEGRGPATAGSERAASFLRDRLKSFGLRPLFGARFDQPFEVIVGARFLDSNALSSGGVRFRLHEDFEPFAFSSSATVSGEAVFIGDADAGPQAAGKVVVALLDAPGKKPTSIRAKVVKAREAKARGILIVRDSLEARPASQLSGTDSDAGIVAFKVTQKTAERILGFRLAQKGPRAAKKRTVEMTASIVREKRTVENVGALLVPPASTSTETVVLGAHYDHLGYGSWASLSGTDKPEIHHGADDNASGTSVVLEVAGALAGDPRGLDRRVAFVLFAGEESGLLGSAKFVKDPPVALGSIAAMVNLDMVGRLRDRKLSVMGTKTSKAFPDLAKSLAEAHGLAGTFGGDGYGPSDHTSFYAEGVPVLFLFTGAHEDYHRPTDTADRLNYPGMALVAAFTIDLVRALSSMHPRPAVERAVGPPPPLSGGDRGYGPYFGSIPDFSESAEGVRLTGVRAGSPAEKAGVQKGDVIVRFGGVTVKNLEDYTVALRARAPGDKVEVEVRRGTEIIKLKAKLEKRP